MFAVWSLIDGDDDPLRDGDGALALYTWTWVGELVANIFIWKRPRVAAAGGAAMGAIAVPALLVRLAGVSESSSSARASAGWRRACGWRPPAMT